MGRKILFYMPEETTANNKNIPLAKKFQEDGWDVYALSHRHKYLRKLAAEGIEPLFCRDYIFFNKTIRRCRIFFLKHYLPLITVGYDFLAFGFYKIMLSRLLQKNNITYCIVASDIAYDLSLVLSNLPHINAAVIQYTLDDTDPGHLKKNLIEKYKGTNLPRSQRYLYRIVRKIFPSFIVRLFGEEVIPFHNFYFFLNTIFHGIHFTTVRKGGGGAKAVFLNGEAYTGLFVQYGVDPKKLIVTGSPEHDSIYGFKIMPPMDTDTRALREQLGITERDDAILFLTQKVDDNPNRYTLHIKNLFLACKKLLPGCKFVVKPHPTQYHDFDVLKKNHPEIIIAEDHDHDPNFNDRLIKICSLAITYNSTLGVNVVGQGKKLVLYHYPNPRVANSYEAIDQGQIIEGTENEIAQVIKKRLNSPLPDNINLSRWCVIDGQACRRIINESKKLLYLGAFLIAPLVSIFFEI